jgi:hypothetical protein
MKSSVRSMSRPDCSKIIETNFRRLKMDISLLYVFLLCLCILIVMYALLCIPCFHRAKWHCSATLIEVFKCFFLSYKAHARVHIAKTEHGPQPSKLVNCVVLCIVCVYMCSVLLLPGVNPIAVDKYIISYHISYHITSYHILSHHISYHILSYLILPYRIVSYHIISSIISDAHIVPISETRSWNGFGT